MNLFFFSFFITPPLTRKKETLKIRHLHYGQKSQILSILLPQKLKTGADMTYSSFSRKKQGKISHLQKTKHKTKHKKPFLATVSKIVYVITALISRIYSFTLLVFRDLDELHTYCNRQTRSW